MMQIFDEFIKNRNKLNKNELRERMRQSENYIIRIIIRLFVY